MYRTLLVPVDGSPAATAGLEEAIRLASALGARLQLMTIVDDRAFDDDGDGDTAGGTASGDLREVVRERGEAVLRHAQGRAEQGGVISATALVRSGGEDLQALVARQAEQAGADLVVLGTHAGKALSRLFMSHDTGHLLNHVAVPVLLVQSAGVDAGLTVIEISGTDSMFQSEP
jgi:nucleotide-binding universal stress UspA family protein